MVAVSGKLGWDTVKEITERKSKPQMEDHLIP